MEAIEKTLYDLFGKNSDIVSVHLFGSHAKGTATPNSDVDCAILFQKETTPDVMKLIEMREVLNDALKQDVDLVCLNSVSPIIAMQVYKYGKTVLKNDPAKYARYIMDLFTDYFDLKIMLEKHHIGRN